MTKDQEPKAEDKEAVELQKKRNKTLIVLIVIVIVCKLLYFMTRMATAT